MACHCCGSTPLGVIMNFSNWTIFSYYCCLHLVLVLKHNKEPFISTVYRGHYVVQLISFRFPILLFLFFCKHFVFGAEKNTKLARFSQKWNNTKLSSIYICTYKCGKKKTCYDNLNNRKHFSTNC